MRYIDTATPQSPRPGDTEQGGSGRIAQNARRPYSRSASIKPGPPRWARAASGKLGTWRRGGRRFRPDPAPHPLPTRLTVTGTATRTPLSRSRCRQPGPDSTQSFCALLCQSACASTVSPSAARRQALPCAAIRALAPHVRCSKEWAAAFHRKGRRRSRPRCSRLVGSAAVPLSASTYMP